jgi:glycosyltransferase involved in cell wall biosynthesis
MNGLSIIVPAHNQAGVILDALASIERKLAFARDQNSMCRSVRCDVVIVDDGSTDDVRSVVSRLRPVQSEYTIVRHDEPTNAACARNDGVAASRGDVIFFLDADDRFLERHIYLCCEALADPAVDFVKTSVAMVDVVHPAWEGPIANSLVINLDEARPSEAS